MLVAKLLLPDAAPASSRLLLTFGTRGGAGEGRITINLLPRTCDLRRLGVDPADVTQIEAIGEKHGSRLFRVVCGAGSFVLKWFGVTAQAIEVRGYELLQQHGVPTLPVHGRADNALLLEDLASSPTWRLAEAADVERPETGVAIADWYRALHAAGRRMLGGPLGAPHFLGREPDALDSASVVEIGQKLGNESDPVWRLAADHIEALKSALRSLPETLNYNDFHWSNLALSRPVGPPLRAIVYDYHLLGIGPAYSDCRNVCGSLGERARAAFWEAYGPVHEREAVLDAPVAILYALRVAVQMPRLPRWADGCVLQARNGELAASLRRALEAL